MLIGGRHLRLADQSVSADESEKECCAIFMCTPFLQKRRPHSLRPHCPGREADTICKAILRHSLRRDELSQREKTEVQNKRSQIPF